LILFQDVSNYKGQSSKPFFRLRFESTKEHQDHDRLEFLQV